MRRLAVEVLTFPLRYLAYLAEEPVRKPASITYSRPPVVRKKAARRKAA